MTRSVGSLKHKKLLLPEPGRLEMSQSRKKQPVNAYIDFQRISRHLPQLL